MGANQDIHIEQTTWQAEADTICSIREQVFVREQAVPRDIAWNDEDQLAMHFLLRQGGTVLGSARLMPDGKIGRLAVLEPHRGQGLGGQMLEAIIDAAMRRGMLHLYLHAQAQATDFYAKYGFAPRGELFEEAAILHQRMDLALDYAGFQQSIMGVNYPQPFASLTVTLAASARRRLYIYSPDLDHEVFDSAELASAVIALVRRSRYSDVRILVNDIQPMIKRGHQLLTVSRRAPSTVRIHKLGKIRDLPNDSFVVRDDDGTIYRPNDADRQGFYEPDSRTAAKRWIDKFDELWNMSQPDAELRLLGI